MTIDPDKMASSDSLTAAAEILRARARVLARPPPRAASAGTMLEVLEFQLARERYAIETRYVREVCPLKDLTPLPCTPAHVLGIVYVRGQILPVFDCKKLFELPDEGLTDFHRIILVRNEDLQLGLLADVILGLRSIPLLSLQPALPTLAGIREDYLKGVTAERVAVLELGRMLSDTRIIIHEEVEG